MDSGCVIRRGKKQDRSFNLVFRYLSFAPRKYLFLRLKTR